MRTMNLTFEDSEFERLQVAKARSRKRSWREFVLSLLDKEEKKKEDNKYQDSFHV